MNNQIAAYEDSVLQRAMEPIVTWAPDDGKYLPLIVILVPPATGPTCGEIVSIIRESGQKKKKQIWGSHL